MDWTPVVISALSGIIGAIVGGLISGYFTYKAAKMNLVHDDRIRLEQIKFEAHLNRPEMSLISSSGNPTQLNLNKKVDLSIFFLPVKGYNSPFMIYPNEAFDDQKLEEYIFEFQNIGKTDIANIWISTNIPNGTALFQYSTFRRFVNKDEAVLSCREILDKQIRVGEKIKIKIICIRNRTISGNVSAPLTIWLVDTNGRWWSQAFFFPYSRIYSSNETTPKEFKAYTDENNILSCYEDPTKW